MRQLLTHCTTTCCCCCCRRSPVAGCSRRPRCLSSRLLRRSRWILRRLLMMLLLRPRLMLFGQPHKLNFCAFGWVTDAQVLRQVEQRRPREQREVLFGDRGACLAFDCQLAPCCLSMLGVGAEEFAGATRGSDRHVLTSVPFGLRMDRVFFFLFILLVFFCFVKRHEKQTIHTKITNTTKHLIRFPYVLIAMPFFYDCCSSGFFAAFA